jgi:hypothetical protein
MEGGRWHNTDDHGNHLISPTPRGLIEQNLAAAKVYNEAHGF